MMKTKILFFIFDLGNGGAEKVLVQLVNSLDPDKYDITVQTIFNHGVNNDSINSYVHRKWLFNRLFKGMKYIIRIFPPSFLHKCLVNEQYDYEIAYLEGIPTRVISGCNNKKTKTFAWVHCQMDNVNTFFNTYLNNSEARKCYEKFNKIAFVSEIAQSSFLYKTGWKGLNTAVVHNTLDIDSIKRLSNEAVSINIDKNVFNLCSVGRLAWQKGYPRLVNVLGQIYREGFTQWHLYILGQGEQRSEIEKNIADNNLQSHITLLGYDTNPYKYVSKMDFFVCSSYKEGYSTAVTESIIVGTPVLTTDCAGMAEILGKEAGIIVENSESALMAGLKKLLEHPEIVPQYKKNAFVRAESFSAESTIKEFEDFIFKKDD